MSPSSRLCPRPAEPTCSGVATEPSPGGGEDTSQEVRRAFCSHQESPSRPTKTIKASKVTKKDLNQIFFGLVANKIGPKWLRPQSGDGGVVVQDIGKVCVKT